MSTQKLKLGLLLDSYEIPAWLFYSLEQIANSDYAEFSAILMNDGRPQENNATWLDTLWKNKDELAYRLFNKIDEKIYYREPDAFRLMNVCNILPEIPLVLIRPMSEGNVDVFRPEDVEKVREFDLDIIIKVGFQQLQGEILKAAKCGVWFFEHSDNRKLRGEPLGFWEVAKGWPETGISLLIANEQPDNNWTVFRSCTIAFPISPARSRNMSFLWSSTFLPRQIELLYRLGKEGFFAETAKFNDEFVLYDQPRYHTPSNLDAVRIYARLFGRNLYEFYQRLFCKECWTLFYDFTECTSLSFGDFKKIPSPKDRFWADPHVIQKDNKIFIFVEEYLYIKRKGHIAVIEMDFQGERKDSVQILEEDYHLSYPFVFEAGDKFYMVPESSANHSIDLYECVQFPDRWEFKMRLMSNVNAVDTTLFYHQGKWWLFTTLSEREGTYPINDLFLFYSDNLLTDQWYPHPQNPVISDVTSARPAGKLFFKNGKLYRPSQNSSKGYGYGFAVNEVLCLSETKYIEKKVAAIKPEWDRRLVATHTFTYGDGIVIIDGLYRPSKL